MLDESVAQGADFPTCLICRKDKEARKRWGCDAEIETPIMEIGCVVCGGRDVLCEHCKGVGRVPLKRCPWKIINRSDSIGVELCLLFLENGTLPYPGALLDQPAAFYDALRIVAGVKGEVFERKMRSPKKGQG